MLRPRRPTSFAPLKSPMDTPHAVEGRRSRRTRLAAILVLIPLIVLGLWFAYRQVWRPTSSVAESNSTSKPSDPRLTFATPYRNVRPDVKYVGDETCAACHATESTSFRRHPMGRSAAWVTCCQTSAGSRPQVVHAVATGTTPTATASSALICVVSSAMPLVSPDDLPSRAS